MPLICLTMTLGGWHRVLQPEEDHSGELRHWRHGSRVFEPVHQAVFYCRTAHRIPGFRASSQIAISKRAVLLQLYWSQFQFKGMPLTHVVIKDIEVTDLNALKSGKDVKPLKVSSSCDSCNNNLPFISLKYPTLEEKFCVQLLWRKNIRQCAENFSIALRIHDNISIFWL